MTLKEKLMNIQAELKAPKNLRNSFGNYNYRNVESILEALKPLLVKYNATVTITDTIEFIADRIYVKAEATIYDVENKNNDADIITSTAYAREAEAKKGMDEAQITGATSSYARKYALNGLFLLDDTQDVDTEAYQKASQKGADKPAQAPKEKPKPKASKPTEAKAEPKKITPTEDPARVELREFIQLNGLNGALIAQMCGLGPQSTSEDFKAALDYAKTMVGGEV